MEAFDTVILGFCRLGIAGKSPWAPGTCGTFLAILPFAGGSLPLLAAAFVIFRIFDIAKPWPIHASENWLPDGWGVMLDDMVGGLMTMLVLLLARALGLMQVPLV